MEERVIFVCLLVCALIPGLIMADLGPAEPETRTLSSEEATALLEQEWLFQAEGKPLPGS